MIVAVVVSPEAEAQIRAVDDWWREHRTAAPGLFAQEAAETIATLQFMPHAGRRFSHPTVPGVRRFLLRATRYHLYYVASGDVLVVVAVWSQVRGTGPDLTGL
jgi:plasmid stabilization system protein ParE